MGALLAGGLIYLLDRWMPAFHDLLVPIYWIIGLLLLAAHWRWIRARTGRRRLADRRQSDRRQSGD